MEGWLTKKGHQFKTWQKRWFVLERHRLCYYEKENKAALKGTYILSASAHITRTPDEGSHKNLFVLHAEGSGGKQLVMSAATPEQLVEWENGINGMINQFKKPAAAKRKKSLTKEAAKEAVGANDDRKPSAVEESPAPRVEPEAAAASAPVSAYKPRTPSKPPQVVVLGASGNVGKATVSSLSRDAPAASVFAGTRDVNSSHAAALRALDGVNVLAADMSSDRSALSKQLSSADRVFIMAPNAEGRADIAINAINACRDAGVGYMLVLSVCSAEKPGTIFSDEFNKVEAAAVASGVPHTIIRLPFFLDNVLGQLQLMVNNGQFYLPVDPNQRYNSVALSDVGDVCAKILADPAPYIGRTVKVTGALYCEAETAVAFSAALGKSVSYVQVPYEAAKASLMDMGMPEWQADGCIELFKMIAASEPALCETGELEAILGRPPVSITEFANRYKIEPAADPEPEAEAASAPVSAYTARAPSNPPQVVVLGASGAIGISTLTNLASLPKSSVAVKACIRDVASAKMKAISHIDHVEVVGGDMGEPQSLKSVLASADRVFVVTPGAEHRAELAINAINACKEAGVGYMVVLSVMSVGKPGTIFADQFLKIEAAAAASEVPHTIVRLPFFLDNVMGQLQLMMNQGQYYGPISPNKKHNSVAISDVGEAFAKILADPSKYVGRVVELCGHLVSENETAAAFSAGLDKKVEYVQVPYEAVQASMVGMGLPEWQASGICEMYRMIEDEDGLLTSHRGELEAILGRPPISITQLAAPVEFSAPKEEAPMKEEEVKQPEPVPEAKPQEVVPPIPAPAAAASAPAKKRESGFVDSLFKEGLMVMKKTGAESRYHERFVWIDMKHQTFNWSKKEFDRSDAKNIPLSSITSVTAPLFEKKTGRRNSILGGGNTEDGHVIKLLHDKGFSIDLKITSANLRTPEQWKETFDAIL